jgi:hypothetical protein
MNLQESIRRILRESLESEWNEGDYDYQHGFCHYFAYNIIDKIRDRFPNKKVNYYLLLANEVDSYSGSIEQEYLLHVYIKIGDKLLDSNGFTTMDEVEERVDDWYQRQLTMVPEEYDINVWEEESDEIPEVFFNNKFCNTKRVKEDITKFLSHPSVIKLLKDTLNESKILDKLKSFFGKKPLTKEEMKDEKLINVIVKFINESYIMEGTRDEWGTVTIYLTDDLGNINYSPIMKYYPDSKRLAYSWDFAKDIHSMIGDNRLLHLDSELMGKVFEKLFKKKINIVQGYSYL